MNHIVLVLLLTYKYVAIHNSYHCFCLYVCITHAIFWWPKATIVTLGHNLFSRHLRISIYVAYLDTECIWISLLCRQGRGVIPQTPGVIPYTNPGESLGGVPLYESHAHKTPQKKQNLKYLIPGLLTAYYYYALDQSALQTGSRLMPVRLPGGNPLYLPWCKPRCGS